MLRSAVLQTTWTALDVESRPVASVKNVLQVSLEVPSSFKTRSVSNFNVKLLKNSQEN